MIRIALISLALTLSAVSPLAAQDTRLMTGGASARVVPAEGFEAEVFARRLGDVSAMARQTDGLIYVAEREAGRIFRIQDRGLDGTADVTQALPHRFDRPTGLAFIGDTLFVADRSGVWQVDPAGGTPKLIAPFARAGATVDPHPIIALDPERLLLGLNRTDGTMQLLEINVTTGAARLREEGPGQIIGFSGAAQSDDNPFPTPWFLLRRDGETRFGLTLANARAMGATVNAVWLDEAKGRAVIAGPNGVRTTVATFAGIRDEGQSLISGLDTPGAMVADERGLFVSDQAGGRIWRLFRLPEPELANIELETVEPETPEPDTTPIRPDLMRGSGIARASTIGPASTLKSGDQPRPETEPDTSPNE